TFLGCSARSSGLKGYGINQFHTTCILVIGAIILSRSNALVHILKELEECGRFALDLKGRNRKTCKQRRGTFNIKSILQLQVMDQTWIDSS
ncbi:hypothetical protein BDR03DRAFT_947113, partial [Suillus americanus]